MMTREAKPGQLVRWNAKKSTVFVRLIEPALPTAIARRIGSVFGVLAAHTDGRAGDALVARIEDAVTRGLEEADSKLAVNVPADRLFEYALTKVNQAAGRLFGETGLDIDPGSIRACLIARSGDAVSAAVWGQPSLLLIRPGDEAPIDILEEGRDAAQPRAIGFGSMIAGALSPGDKMLLSTEDVRDLVGAERLTSIIAMNPPEAAAVVLRDAFAPLADNLAVAITVFGDESAIAHYAPPRRAERAVAAPDHAPTRPASVQRTAPAPRQRVPEAAAVPPMRSPVEEPDLPAPQPRKPMLANAFKAALAILSTVAQAFSPSRIKATVTGAPGRAIARFNALSGKRKVVLLTICILAILFNASLVVLGIRKGARTKAENYDRSVGEVEHLIDNADASLIYKDETRAKAMLDEATTRAAALPVATDEQKQRHDALTQRIDAKRVSLRHEVRLAAPQTLLAGHGANSIAFDGTSLWLLDGETGISRIAADGTLENVSAAPSGTPIGIAQTDTGVVAIGSKGAVAVSAKGAAKPVTIDWNSADINVDDAASWGASLYVLDAAHNRILKLPATEGGYGPPQPYVKDGTDLSNAASIAIDGSLYALLRDGKAFKLTKGTAVAYSLAAPDPAVTSATRVRTTKDSNSLYVLEQSQRRVLAYTKDGKFLSQYVNDAMRDARDVAVDEKAHTLFVATSSSILKFPLPQQ